MRDSGGERTTQQFNESAVSRYTGRMNSSLLMGTVILLSLMGGALILASNGRPLIGTGYLFLVVLVGGSLYRLEWGFMAFIGCVLFFDQFEVPGFDSVTYAVNYFNNLNTIPYLPYFARGVVSPMDLHLAFLIALWLITRIVQGRFRIYGVPLWLLLVLFLGWLGFLLVYGMRMGGDFVTALWELRGFFYFGMVYLFVPQVIRTYEHVHALLWVCIAAITGKALLGGTRFAMKGFSMAGFDTYLNHEEPLFIITLLVFLMALLLFSAKTRQKTVLLLLALPLVLGFYSGNRRAAYASLAASLVAFVLLLPRRESVRFLKLGVPVVILLLVYGAVFWESDSKLATPLKQLKSGFEDDRDLSERNYWSNLYRKIEDYNLAITLQSSPVVGIGFGTKYEQPLDLAKITFSLRDYMAHNNIIWLFVKTGVIGFFLFWFFLNGFAARGAGIVARLQDPYAKALAVTIVVAVINQITAAYFDLHLVRYRTMIYLALLMSLMPVLVSGGARTVSRVLHHAN